MSEERYDCDTIINSLYINPKVLLLLIAGGGNDFACYVHVVDGNSLEEDSRNALALAKGTKLTENQARAFFPGVFRKLESIDYFYRL